MNPISTQKEFAKIDIMEFHGHVMRQIRKQEAIVRHNFSLVIAEFDAEVLRQQIISEANAEINDILRIVAGLQGRVASLTDTIDKLKKASWANRARQA